MIHNKRIVLVAGRSQENLTTLMTLLSGHPSAEVRKHFIHNGHSDPLYGLGYEPDVLIYDLSGAWEEELAAVAAHRRHERVPLIVIGPPGEARAMRLAMQAGARDFFTHPMPVDELLRAVEQVIQEASETGRSKDATVTAVINAKGGSGASFLAVNLADAMNRRLGLRTALVDLDLQFGNLPLYLDLKPRDGLFGALAMEDQLDPVALEGFVTRHESGLDLLAAVAEGVPLPWDVPEAAFHHLLDVLANAYQAVVVDLPRQIDPLTATVLDRADRVVMVVQQDLTSLRDAKRLLDIFRSELRLPPEQVIALVNRYQERSDVTTEHVAQALKGCEVASVPNDFRRASQAVNAGVTLFSDERGAAITRAVLDLARRLAGTAPHKPPGLLRGLMSRLMNAGNTKGALQ